MHIRNNTQVKHEQSYSSETGNAVSNQSARSAIDRISAEPTTAESLSSGPTTPERLSDQSPEYNPPFDEKQSGVNDPVARLGGPSIVSTHALLMLKPPIVEIQNRIEQLEAKLETASSPFEHKLIEFQLHVARGELKAESLKLLENELMALNDSPRPNNDAPYEQIGTGQITRADLEALATGDENDPLSIAARTTLNEPGFFEFISGESTPIKINGIFGDLITFILTPSITLDDIQAARLNVEKDIENVEETNDGNGDYEVPEGDDFTISSTADQVEIGQIAFDAQQNAIEESIRTGEEVEFVNSVGDTVSVTVTPTQSNGSASYSVEVREGSKTNTFAVNSEIGTEDTIAGIANIVDWGSSLATGPNVPGFPTTVNFRQEGDPNAAAFANGPADAMNFLNGAGNINKSRYMHEMGHLIGYSLYDSSTEIMRYSPAGWENVLATAVGDISSYTKNSQEEFSEAFAAYVNAADHGPEALAEFREAFPDRAEYIENNILGNQVPVVVPDKPANPVFPLPLHRGIG